MTWENRTETFTLPRVKQTTRVSSMHEAVPWDSLEGWGEEGGGRGLQDGGHIPTASSCWCTAKTITIL